MSIMTALDSASLKSAEALADWGTWLVIIGVAGEGIEIAIKICEHKVKNEGFSAWCKKHNFAIEIWGGIFWLMVVVGLGMEFRGNHKSQQIVQNENTRITQIAGEAIKQAAIANDRASSNELQVAGLKLKIEELRKKNDEYAQSQSILEEAAYPRFIVDRGGASKRLSKFAGTNAVLISANDSDSIKFGEEIKSMLQEAKWNISETTNSSLRPNLGPGVATEFNTWSGEARFPELDQSSGEALVDELNKKQPQARHVVITSINRNFPNGALVINVGPHPTALQALQLEAQLKMTPEERSNVWQRVLQHSR
jgi:hypothetical protein